MERLNHAGQDIVKTLRAFLPLRVGGVCGADGERAGVRCSFHHLRVPGEHAFSRPDLLALIGAGIILLAVLWPVLFGEFGRTLRCQSQLKVLGNAMQGFAAEHSGALPPAVVDSQQIFWDSQIIPYLPFSLVKGGIEPAFKCPSDTLPHARARSYTMSAHDMKNENWPPGPGNATGVGLVWNQETISRLLGEQGLGAAATNVNTLALLKLSGVPAPAATMVLTELISPDNNLKGGAFAAIDGPGSQVVQPLNGVTCVHHGRYNYLMLDGHVERMSPLQAQDSAGNQRIWSIKKSD